LFPTSAAGCSLDIGNKIQGLSEPTKEPRGETAGTPSSQTTQSKSGNLGVDASDEHFMKNSPPLTKKGETSSTSFSSLVDKHKTSGGNSTKGGTEEIPKSDYYSIENENYKHICVLPEFVSRGIEELRWEDFLLHRKTINSPNTASCNSAGFPAANNPKKRNLSSVINRNHSTNDANNTNPNTFSFSTAPATAFGIFSVPPIGSASIPVKFKVHPKPQIYRMDLEENFTVSNFLRMVIHELKLPVNPYIVTSGSENVILHKNIRMKSVNGQILEISVEK